MNARRDAVLAHVSSNLRRFRQALGMSQNALAEASGLSRRMIVNLEAGDTNISLSSLDRLAEALGVNFVAIVADPTASTRQIEAVAWRGKLPESVGILLGSAPATREAQLWSWSLGPGERYQASPDPAEWHEMIFVMEGRLHIEKQDGPLTIDAGGFAIYSSDQTYAYVNAGHGVVRFIRNVIC